MRLAGALGAPDWAVNMAADLMFSVEYELDYQTLLQLDEVVETSHTNITNFMGVSQSLSIRVVY